MCVCHSLQEDRSVTGLEALFIFSLLRQHPAPAPVPGIPLCARARLPDPALVGDLVRSTVRRIVASGSLALSRREGQW